MSNKLINISEIARRLSITRPGAEYYFKKGVIKPAKLGGKNNSRTWFRESDVDLIKQYRQLTKYIRENKLGEKFHKRNFERVISNITAIISELKISRKPIK